MCSAWRIRRDNDIGTFGEKHRRSQVVQTGVMSVWNRIHVLHSDVPSEQLKQQG